MERRHGGSFWVAMLLLPATVLVAVCEVALRVLAPGPAASLPAGEPASAWLALSERTEVEETTQGGLMGLVRPSARPGLVYELKPRRSWRIEGRQARTNELGFRGHAPARGRESGSYRIVGIGDSVTFGWGVGDDETFLERVDFALESRMGPNSVEVLNFGVPGYNSAQEAVLLRELVFSLDPDLVVLGYVLNDAEPTLFADEPRDGIALRSSRLLQLGRDLWLAGESRAAVARRAMEAGLSDIARRAGERGVPVLFFVYPNAWRGQDPALPLRLARALAFACVDMHAAFDEHYRKTGAGFRDVALSATDAHPNPVGHALIAEALRELAVALLRQRRRAAGQDPGSRRRLDGGGVATTIRVRGE